MKMDVSEDSPNGNLGQIMRTSLNLGSNFLDKPKSLEFSEKLVTQDDRRAMLQLRPLRFKQRLPGVKLYVCFDKWGKGLSKCCGHLVLNASRCLNAYYTYVTYVPKTS